MFGASFLTGIWIAWGVGCGFRGLDDLEICDQFARGELRDPRSRTEACQSAKYQALVARVGRVTLWAKYCGFASLGFLLIGAVVWVYRGIIAFNAGLPP